MYPFLGVYRPRVAWAVWSPRGSCVAGPPVPPQHPFMDWNKWLPTVRLKTLATLPVMYAWELLEAARNHCLLLRVSCGQIEVKRHSAPPINQLASTSHGLTNHQKPGVRSPKNVCMCSENRCCRMVLRAGDHWSIRVPVP